MPLFVLFKLRKFLFPFLTSLLCNLFQCVLNSRHHPLQSTEVYVSPAIQEFKDFVAVLLNLVLDIHFSSTLVLLLPAKSSVVAEVIWIVLKILAEFIVI